MGLTVTREVSAGGVPVFQQATENAQGGFTLDTTGLTTGAIVPAGTVMGFDSATRKAKVLKVAQMQANATNTGKALRVLKGHLIVVGDIITNAVGGAAYAVASVDTSNAGYDVLNIGTTLGVALTAGDAIIVGTTEGTDTGNYATVAKGLLYQEVKVGVNEGVAIAIRATVYERRIPIVTDAIKALLPNIIFSKSY